MASSKQGDATKGIEQRIGAGPFVDDVDHSLTGALHHPARAMEDAPSHGLAPDIDPGTVEQLIPVPPMRGRPARSREHLSTPPDVSSYHSGGGARPSAFGWEFLASGVAAPAIRPLPPRRLTPDPAEVDIHQGVGNTRFGCRAWFSDSIY